MQEKKSKVIFQNVPPCNIHPWKFKMSSHKKGFKWLFVLLFMILNFIFQNTLVCALFLCTYHYYKSTIFFVLAPFLSPLSLTPHVLRAKFKKSWSKDGTIIFGNRGQFRSRIWRKLKKFLENSWEIDTFTFLTKIRKKSTENGKLSKNSLFFSFYLHVRWLIISKFNQKIKFGFEKINLYRKNWRKMLQKLKNIKFLKFWIFKYFAFFSIFKWVSAPGQWPITTDSLRWFFWVLKLIFYLFKSWTNDTNLFVKKS